MVANGPMYDSLGRGNANIRLTGYYQYDIWAYKGTTWRNTPDLRREDINWVDIHELKYNNPVSVDFGKPTNTQFLAAQVDRFKHVYAMPHYIMYNPQDDPKATPMGGNGDWYIFRLAETYLLGAEAPRALADSIAGNHCKTKGGSIRISVMTARTAIFRR